MHAMLLRVVDQEADSWRRYYGFPTCRAKLGNIGVEMTTTRRDFVMGTGATLAAATLAASAAGDSQDVAARSLLEEISEELLIDYPENADGARDRHRRSRRA